MITNLNGIRHYGKDKPYQGKETKFQESAIGFIRMFDKKAYHVPNEGKRKAKTGANLKRQGLMKGAPDIVSHMPHDGYFGFLAELKVEGGKLSQEQWEFLITQKRRGHFVCVPWSMDGFIQACKDYFKGRLDIKY